MRRPAFLTALATVVLAATAVVVPQTAQAATAPVVSSVAGAPSDPGIILVTASSAAPITAVSVTVVDAAAPTHVLATLDAFHLVSGTDTDGQWQADTRLVLATYALVTLHATVTDSASVVSADVSASLSYSFGLRVLEHAVGALDLDRLHPALVATGRAQVVDPKTGTAFSAGGYDVTVSSADGSITQLIAPDGTYSVSMTPSTPTDGAVVAFSVVINGELVDSGSYTEHVSQARIVIKTSVPKVPRNTPVTITGDVEVLDAGLWVPQTNAVVALGDTDGWITSAPVDAQGHVSFTHSFASRTTLKMAFATGGRPGMVTDAVASLPLTVLVPAFPFWTAPAINEFSELVLQGIVQPLDFVGYIPGGRLYVQQSPNGTTGWTTLGYLPLKAGGQFDTAVYVAKPSGYWRLYAVPTGDFLPAASKPVRLTRIVTRMASVTAPTSVRRGSVATIRGVVQIQTGSTWKGISHAAVYVYFKARGTTTWRAVTGVRASTTGVFTARVRPARTGQWLAVWFTFTKNDINAYSRAMTIAVR